MNTLKTLTAAAALMLVAGAAQAGDDVITAKQAAEKEVQSFCNEFKTRLACTNPSLRELFLANSELYHKILSEQDAAGGVAFNFENDAHPPNKCPGEEVSLPSALDCVTHRLQSVNARYSAWAAAHPADARFSAWAAAHPGEELSPTCRQMQISYDECLVKAGIDRSNWMRVVFANSSGDYRRALERQLPAFDPANVCSPIKSHAYQIGCPDGVPQ
jgi:hypothetical protein